MRTTLAMLKTRILSIAILTAAIAIFLRWYLGDWYGIHIFVALALGSYLRLVEPVTRVWELNTRKAEEARQDSRRTAHYTFVAVGVGVFLLMACMALLFHLAGSAAETVGALGVAAAWGIAIIVSHDSFEQRMASEEKQDKMIEILREIRDRLPEA